MMGHIISYAKPKVLNCGIPPSCGLPNSQLNFNPFSS